MKKIGWSVQIKRNDGSRHLFVANPDKGAAVWDDKNKAYASAFARELRIHGINARRVQA